MCEVLCSGWMAPIIGAIIAILWYYFKVRILANIQHENNVNIENEKRKLNEQLEQRKRELEEEYSLREDKRNRDRALFGELKQLLPSSMVSYLCTEYEFGCGTLNNKYFDPFVSFLEIWIRPEYKFHNAKIEAVKHKLYELVNEYVGTIYQYTSPDKTSDKCRVREKPWNVERRSSEEDVGKYDYETKVLNDIATLVGKSYYELVELSKNELGV